MGNIPTQVKLNDLHMTNMDTGETSVIISDIYDIIDMNSEFLHIKNTNTNEDIVVTHEMVEKYFYNNISE